MDGRKHLTSGFVKELSAFGLNNIPIFSVYSAQSEDVKTVLGKAGEGMIYSYPDIGGQDALDYFPKLAAQSLTNAIKQCGEDMECANSFLRTKGGFEANGVLKGKLLLKTIKDGEFVAYNR